MPVDSNALSLDKWALYSNSPKAMRVTYSLLESDSALNDIPLTTAKVLVATGRRFVAGSLPTPNWVPINQNPTVVNAVPSPWQEQLYVLRNSFHTDRMLLEAEGAIVNPMAKEIEAYLMSVRIAYTDAFFNNNHVTGDPHAIVGLRARLDNPTVYGCASDLKINAGGVDMTQATGTASTGNNFLELVDLLLSRLGRKNGEGVVLYMNGTMYRRFNRQLRLMGGTGGFTPSTDQFQRSISLYKQAVVREIGLKQDEATEIITSTEDSAGLDGSSTYTSIYGVRYGEDAMMGWQFRPLSEAIIGPTLLDNQVTYSTTFDWAMGLAPQSTRCIGRLYGIKLA